ncbi:MAG: hypothetical protein FJ225_04100 [Lentisphaerae bacterium]|nr:hypothetical protein [Lentisphaerota bacterium]
MKDPTSAGRLRRFIRKARCYAGLPRHAHTPAFHLAAVEDPKYREKYSWIMDGAQKIGILNLDFGEIELLRFFPPAGGAPVEYRMPAIYDWRKLSGVRITIVPQSTWTGRGKLTRPRGRGATLRLDYRETLEDGARMTHGFRLRFDPALGYVLDGAFDLRMKKPREFEYANILAAGLMESREERKRYQKCIWTRRDGTFCYQYQNPLSRMELAGPKWSHMSKGGFVGWVAERDMNPFLEIVRSTPTRFVTCSQWYDQHVIGMAPRRRSRDGLYHIEAVYRLVSLPLSVAKELEDAARAMLPVDRGMVKAGFRYGVVNDFETPIPGGTPYNGCAWTREARPDSRVAHSGRRSLRLRGGQEAFANDCGTAIFLESAKRYRLSAWVRTRGVTGRGAFLRLSEVFWNWGDVRASHETKRLTGDTDWTLLECEFRPVPDDPLALLSLVVEGGGTAWFDDVALVEAAPGKAARRSAG